MIKNTAQAEAIQKKRVADGKRGYAKAVRRFCRAVEKENGVSYGKSISALPVAWPDKVEKPAMQARGRAA